MEKIKLRKWDTVEHLKTDEDNPSFGTILKFTPALGIKLELQLSPVPA